MSQGNEPPTFESKSPPVEARKAKTTAGASDQPLSNGLIAFTIDAATGRIVKVERVDSAGAHHELSEDDRAGLARNAKATLARVVEQAFEAGIDCVLGDQAGKGEKESAESEDDAELSRALLQSLIEHSAAKRLMQREVQSRAIMGTLIEQAIGLRAATPERTAPH